LNAANALSSYNGPDATLDSDAMARITEWLVNRV
jgi:hypothetical protein